MTTPAPPAELSWLTDAIGAEATLRLIEEHGGTRLYVPKEPNQGTPIAHLVGLVGAQRLASAFGGDYLKVPLAKNWRVRLYRARGDSYSAIARRVGMTESAVGRILSAAGVTQNQLTLFP